MSFQANVLRAMIASPGDVAEERRIATEVIHRWNSANATSRQLVVLPVKWETNSSPEYGEHPQSVINRQVLLDADLVIGIFGSRLGTPTAEYPSGTVEEIKKHVAAAKAAMLYFSDAPLDRSSHDAGQYAALQQFRQECKSAGLYAVYKTVEQFRSDFNHHLDLHLNQARYRWLDIPAAERSDETAKKTAERKRKVQLTQAGLDKMQPYQVDFIRWALDRGELEETRIMNAKTGLHPHAIREGITEGERAGLLSVRMGTSLLAPGGERIVSINPNFHEALVEILNKQE